MKELTTYMSERDTDGSRTDETSPSVLDSVHPLWYCSTILGQSDVLIVYIGETGKRYVDRKEMWMS